MQANIIIFGKDIIMKRRFINYSVKEPDKTDNLDRKLVDKNWFDNRWVDIYYFQRDWFGKKWIDRYKFIKN